LKKNGHDRVHQEILHTIFDVGGQEENREEKRSDIGKKKGTEG